MRKPTFTAVNYSLRPSKTIQRALIFDGLRRLQDSVDWSRARYIGFGSIWFTDFVLAHRILGLSRMVSIEQNLIGYRRALFNKPYRFVRVRRGVSYDVLPNLLGQPRYQNTPSIVWLDYDSELDEDKIKELRDTVVAATPDSVLLATFNAGSKRYGEDSSDVLGRLTDLFGEFATRRLDRRDVRGLALAQTLGTLTQNMLANVSRRISKANPCVPAFRIAYQDKASMVTVGVVFPDEGNATSVSKVIRSSTWPGFVEEPVVAPHLTSREVAVLQSALPSPEGLSRQAIRELGFDLEEEQIRAFEQFYRHYPTFAQIIS